MNLLGSFFMISFIWESFSRLSSFPKITIVPRTSGALGYTMQVEEGNHYLMSQKELAK